MDVQSDSVLHVPSLELIGFQIGSDNQEQNWAVLGYYTASNGNSLPTFRDNGSSLPTLRKMTIHYRRFGTMAVPYRRFGK